MKIVTTIALTLALTQYALAGDFVIAERGKPAERAVKLPADATALERYAAKELVKYVEKLTGVQLTIQDNSSPAHGVMIGRGDPQWGTDSFRLEIRDGDLHIDGVKRGALFGVYELLERFGKCGFYSSWCEVVPKADRLAVPDTLSERQTPAFLLREPFWNDLTSNHDFAAKLKVNNHSWRTVDPKLGGNELVFGPSLGTCHTFFNIVPPKTYFKDHPEYFSEVGGVRKGEGAQLCLTNPDVLKLAIAYVLDCAAKHPEAQVFGVSQNDWYNFCTCPKCKAIADREGSQSGPIIEFVNQIADALAEKFPDKYVETLAYQYSQKPPKNVTPRKNVVICFCSIECEFGNSFETSSFKANRQLLEDFRGWSAITGNIFVWDYTTDFNHYLLPLPNVLTLQDNVKFFRKGGVKWLFEQGAHGHSWHADFAELKAWLLAKWLWNPDYDREKLMTEFFNGYYGKAAPIIRQYFDEFNAVFSPEVKKTHLIRAFTPITVVSDVVDDERLLGWRKLWRKAEKLVADDPVRLYNVRMGEMPLDYLEFSRHSKSVNLMKNPEDFKHCSGRNPAKRLLSRIREAEKAGRTVVFCEDVKGESSRIRQRLESAAAGDKKTLGDGSKVTFEEDAFSRGGPADACKIVDDGAASGGKALLLANDNYQWYTTYQLSQVAFDTNAWYKIRVRLRTELTGEPGPVLRVGVYDGGIRKEFALTLKSDDITSKDYAWYDTAKWMPRAKAMPMIFIAPGHFDKEKFSTSPYQKGVWIDSWSIERIEP